jgi:hypothetical protein
LGGGDKGGRRGKGGSGEGGRNDPNIVCTYEYNLKKRKKKEGDGTNNAYTCKLSVKMIN